MKGRDYCTISNCASLEEETEWLNYLIKHDLSYQKKHTLHHFEWHNDKWLNSPELVSPFGDLLPYYWCGLKWLINYLTHASKNHKQKKNKQSKTGHRHQLNCGISPFIYFFAHSVFLPWFYMTLQYFVGHCDKWDLILMDKLLLGANRRLCHRISHYQAPDGIWREFISGVISFLKANDFPHNKMVGQSQGLVIGKWNHVFLSVPAVCLQIAMITRWLVWRKTFPWRHLTWEASAPFSPCAVQCVSVLLHPFWYQKKGN